MRTDEDCELRAKERFWAKVDKSGGPGACWPWQAGVVSGGYGSFKYRGRMVAAHRFALGAVEPTPGLEACHSCGNPLCCNPAHLRLGTRSSNQRDRVLHGTSNRGNTWARGERHGQSKITAVDVLRMRQERNAGGLTLKELAESYGISEAQVSRIVNGKSWKHTK